MVKKIFKYTLTGGRITLPVGAQVLCIEPQDNQICCWAVVDPTEKKTFVSHVVIGTGHEIPKEATQYVKTFHFKGYDGSNLVLHLYECWHNPLANK